ncbi:MAG: thioredoxin domain-containing protein [Betaproteobacteria bacterium]
MPNRLAEETSPYLLQHANNPVDWYPWGDEALRRAREEERPILLSIGYSACHWCHVMAHESFEDPATAAVMNRMFVNIKVDREERPDLDHIYQTAHQMLTRRAGGWPLTIFLTPSGVPFFSGTYFPKVGRHGLPPFADLLRGVGTAWRDQKAVIEQENASLVDALNSLRPTPMTFPEKMGDQLVSESLRQLQSRFDAFHGGFGSAPKFPHPTDLALILRAGSEAQRRHVFLTLSRMAEGGIFDQLGGGFFRYSVDAEWGIPHFEKMLYDNALLLGVYSDAWALHGDALYQRTVAMTVDWVMREMHSPAGAFFAALDADTEGEEGAAYVWSRDQLAGLLSAEEYASFSAAYGLAGPPNFEGRWHLRVVKRTGDTMQLHHAKAKALEARQMRPQPGRDDKILTGWNGLMISGLLHAGRVFHRPDWIAAGQAALAFLRRELWRDGRLYACWKDGQVRHNGYLDDYAFLLAACVESLQASFRLEDLEFATGLADALLSRFEDEVGGFYFTSHDHERLLYRPKIGHDAAVPAGNGVAAEALLHLAHLTGERRYALSAERTLICFANELDRLPTGSASLLMALLEWSAPSSTVILRGPAAGVADWMAGLDAPPVSGVLALAIPDGVDHLPPVLDKPTSGGVNAWVCEDVNCLPPFEDLQTLSQWFAERKKGITIRGQI